MTDRCPDCGALIALVGIRHRCNGKPKTPERPMVMHTKSISMAEAEKMFPGKAGRPRIAPKKPLTFNPIGSGRTPKVDKKKTLAHTKPWLKAGMSRATYFRRQAEKAK